MRVSASTFNGWDYAEWFNPEGKQITFELFRTGENGYMGQVKFPSAGNYTLVVNPELTTTGSATVTAYNASDVTGTITPTTGGGNTNGFIVPGQYARITFAGVEGKLVTIKAKESTIAAGHVAVLNSEGAKVGSEASFGTSENASLEVTPPTTGTYTIFITPTLPDTGSLKLTAYLGSHLGRPVSGLAA